MTQTVRNFIGLEDLVALRLQCKECSATLTLPLSNQSFSVPQQCPSCRSDWYQKPGNQTSMSDVLRELVSELKRVKRLTIEHPAESLGFTLDAEVTGLLDARASSSHGA